ncbi:ABC-F family ATP-binding cassette domain-containing protein [Oceanobacillus alkalisoli]|uniref:ABC-F family ATP-binding cassette domain-containing protein n=1 Tax=Oceanobacillus alkalisoli TaxID=2925113 RepID=UPI001EE476C1|nr:ABC-F family ATP-binding cassette domain-containing protein [Oceanobacillus alkalisoli]MCG5104949.1 ABC-F family ATP-binding cassette domain-containing protein [Oceanobacillus alkalisoli]
MLTAEQLYKSYGDKILFDSIDFTISPSERIGLIGVNGTGKSTLLRTIAGLASLEKGTIAQAKDYEIEYLAQEPELDPQLTVIEQIYYGDSALMKLLRAYEHALLELQMEPENEKLQETLLNLQRQMDEQDAWEANTGAKTILTKLGITAFEKRTGELSGGQKKRIALAKALIQPADLLILDEPTNHLDHVTVEWLEKYLQTYPGALLLVTHDRYFLNRVTNRIFELDNGNLYSYEGNYEFFLEKKAEREELERESEAKHHNLLRRELAWLKRGARARSTKQKARIGRVEELQEKKFDTKNQEIEVQVGSHRLGKKVLELESISKSFVDKQVLEDFSELIIRGDRIGIIGPNGSGKTSLLNIMAGRLAPDTGSVEVGETVKIGYYTQGDEELDGEQRVIDYIKETAEVVHTVDGDVITAEQMCERFLFSRSEQYTYIRRLSGGEKRRLYLLKILMEEPNVLFLDEPTNDLDTQTLGVLEEYLHHFPGVVVTVSHDRYFLDRVAERLIIFTETGEIERYLGTYSEYLEKNRMKESEEKLPKREKPIVKEKKQKKLTYLEQKEWETIEDDIMALEERVSELEQGVADAGSDAGEVQRLFKEQEEVQEELDLKMERWEELSLIVEASGNQ